MVFSYISINKSDWIFIHCHLYCYIHKNKSNKYIFKYTWCIRLKYLALYSCNRVLQLCIYRIKCKQVPTLNFNGNRLKLTLLSSCNLYKYNRIPFLFVIYIRKYNSITGTLIPQQERKVKQLFPNGKSIRNLRARGRFFGNIRFSEGQF